MPGTNIEPEIIDRGEPPEDTLFYWAKRYVQAIEAAEEPMPSPYADAEIEYCEDNMRRHLNKGVVSNLKAKFGEGVMEGRA